MKSPKWLFKFRFASVWFQDTNACRYNFTWEDPTEREFGLIEIPAFVLKARLWIVKGDSVLSTEQV